MRLRSRSSRTGSRAWRAAGLDDRERGEQHRGGGERGNDLGIAPVGDAVGAGGGADQAVDQGGDPGGAGDGAGQVEPAAAARGLGQHPRGGQRGRGADGHVDEQHPPPRGVGGQQAAADQADRAAGDAHRGVHAERPGARRALGEGGGDQRQRGRGDQRPAGALHRAGGEQKRLAAGEPAGQRRGGEQHQPGDEHAAAAQPVPGPPAEQQQPAEGQRVRVDHPLQARPGKAQRPLDVRQRNVHDRRVQHHHQLRRGQHQQGQARAALAAARRAAAGWPGDSCGLGSCFGHDVSPQSVLVSRWRVDLLLGRGLVSAWRLRWRVLAF